MTMDPHYSDFVDPRNAVQAHFVPGRRPRGILPAVSDKPLSTSHPSYHSIRKLHQGATIEKGGLPPTGPNKALVASENWTIYKPEGNKYSVLQRDGRGRKQVRSLPASGSKEALQGEPQRQVTSAPGRKAAPPRKLSPVPLPKVDTLVKGSYDQGDVIHINGDLRRSTQPRQSKPQGRPPAGAPRKSPVKEADSKFASSWAETRAEIAHVSREGESPSKSKPQETKPETERKPKDVDPFHAKKSTPNTAPEIPEKIEKHKTVVKPTRERESNVRPVVVSPQRKEPEEKPLVREHPRPRPKPVAKEKTVGDTQKITQQNTDLESDKKTERKKFKPPIPRQKTKTFIRREPTKSKMERTKTQAQLISQKTMDPDAKYTVNDAITVYTTDAEATKPRTPAVRVKTAKAEKPPNPYTDSKRSIPPWHRKEYVLNKREASTYQHIKKVYGNEKLRKKRESQFYDKVMELQVEKWREQHAEYAKKIEFKTMNKEQQQKQLQKLREKFEEEQVERFRTQYVTSRVLAHEWNTRHEYGLPEDLNSSPQNQAKLRNPNKPPKETFSVKQKHKKNVYRWKEIFRDPKISVYGLNHKEPKMEGIDTVQLDENNNEGGGKKRAVKDVVRDAAKMLESDQDDDDDDSMYMTDSEDEDNSLGDLVRKYNASSPVGQKPNVSQKKTSKTQPGRKPANSQSKQQQPAVTSTMNAAQSLYGNQAPKNNKPVSINKSTSVSKSQNPNQAKSKGNQVKTGNGKKPDANDDGGLTTKMVPLQSKPRKPEPSWRKGPGVGGLLVGDEVLKTSGDSKTTHPNKAKEGNPTTGSSDTNPDSGNNAASGKDNGPDKLSSNHGEDRNSSSGPDRTPQGTSSGENGSTLPTGTGTRGRTESVHRGGDDSDQTGTRHASDAETSDNSQAAAPPKAANQTRDADSGSAGDHQRTPRQPGDNDSNESSPERKESDSHHDTGKSGDETKGSSGPHDTSEHELSPASQSGGDRSTDHPGGSSGSQADEKQGSGDKSGKGQAADDNIGQGETASGIPGEDPTSRDNPGQSQTPGDNPGQPSNDGQNSGNHQISGDGEDSGGGQPLADSQHQPEGHGGGSSGPYSTSPTTDSPSKGDVTGTDDKTHQSPHGSQGNSGKSNESGARTGKGDSDGIGDSGGHGEPNKGTISGLDPGGSSGIGKKPVTGEQGDNKGSVPDGTRVNEGRTSDDSNKLNLSSKDPKGSDPSASRKEPVKSTSREKEDSQIPGQRKVRIQTPPPTEKKSRDKSTLKSQQSKSDNTTEKSRRKSVSRDVASDTDRPTQGKKKKKKVTEDDLNHKRPESSPKKKKKAGLKPKIVDDDDDLIGSSKKKERSITPQEKEKKQRSSSGKKDTKITSKRSGPAYLQDSSRPDVPEKELQLTDDDTDSDEDIFEKAKRKYGIVIDSDED